MRILSCVWRSYYDDPVAVNPIYYYFVDELRKLGHEVCHFDHVEQARNNKEAMNDLFLGAIRGGRFDLVLVEMLTDQFIPEVLDSAKDYATTVAFDSDDDFRWADYSSHWIPHFTYGVTTYRHVYEAARPIHDNLILSQWASTGAYDGLNIDKDIAVSFAGGIHADRARRFAELGQRVPLQVFGAGADRAQATPRRLGRILLHRVKGGRGTRKALKDWTLLRMGESASSISYAEANALWNRTRISFTPLGLSGRQYAEKLDMARKMGFADGATDSSLWLSPMQVKGRVFEMGTSGTMMLCDRNPELDEFYERGKDYEDFESPDECVEKIRFFLTHEESRRRIARSYYETTRARHLWSHRFDALFRAMQLSP